MTNKIVYRCDTEWDLGLGNDVFETVALAMEVMKQAHDDCEVEEDFEELLEGGLYNINEVTLHG